METTMLDRLTRMLAAAGLALAALAFAGTAASQEKPKVDPAQTCTLDYQRADNMWAGEGQPSASLGTETISLPASQTKAFVADWKYEKLRNDGTTYYGSHMRVATNRGQRAVNLYINAWVWVGLKYGPKDLWVTLQPGESKAYRADLKQVSCS
jgi:hypothetical protein